MISMPNEQKAKKDILSGVMNEFKGDDFDDEVADMQRIGKTDDVNEINDDDDISIPADMQRIDSKKVEEIEEDEVEEDEVEEDEVEDIIDTDDEEPENFIDHDEWIAQGRDPDDFKGKNAYKNECAFVNAKSSHHLHISFQGINLYIIHEDKIPI